MSFFNDQNSCQTSTNPLNKILDNSIEHAQYNNFKNGSDFSNKQNIHRFQNIDSSVQNEFNNFSNSQNHPFELSSNSIINPNNLNIRNNMYAEQQFNLQNSSQSTWSQDFSNLSISDNRIQNTPSINTYQQHQHQYRQNQHQHPINVLTSNLNQFSSNIHRLHNFNQQQQASNQSTIQPQLYEINKEFDNVFNEVETEITTDLQLQSKNFDDDLEKDQEKEDPNIEINEEEDKIKFAMLAQNVFNIMNNTPKNVSSQTTNKFKASAFMQLMNKVSNREIEISNDKKKLVDQNGADIRSKLSDPLVGLNLNDNLDSSFDAAIKISQTSLLEVNANNWQSEFS